MPPKVKPAKFIRLTNPETGKGFSVGPYKTKPWRELIKKRVEGSDSAKKIIEQLGKYEAYIKHLEDKFKREISALKRELAKERARADRAIKMADKAGLIALKKQAQESQARGYKQAEKFAERLKARHIGQTSREYGESLGGIVEEHDNEGTPIKEFKKFVEGVTDNKINLSPAKTAVLIESPKFLDAFNKLYPDPETRDKKLQEFINPGSIYSKANWSYSDVKKKKKKIDHFDEAFKYLGES